MFPGLNQTITLWKRGSQNMTGGYTWSSPKTFKGRWEYHAEEVRTDDGSYKVARSRVFSTGVDMQVGDYLKLGKSTATDPTREPDADEILDFTNTPSVDGKRYLGRALL